MLINEIGRVLRRRLFWIMAVGIGILKFIGTFSYSGDFESVLEDPSTTSLYYVESFMGGWGSFVFYAIPSLCACATAGGIMEDIRCRKYNYVLPRAGFLRYVCCKITALCICSFLCMAAGVVVFYLLGTIVFGIPVVSGMERMYQSVVLDPMIQEGHYGRYLLLYEAWFCMTGVFLSLLTALLSLWVQDAKIVMIFPAIFMYFMWYILTPDTQNKFVNRFLVPKYVFMDDFWDTRHVARLLCAAVYTLVMALLVGGILYGRVKHWRKGGIA